MEKRFIVIKCKTLEDQYECDADREIQPALYTEEEVKALFHKKTYFNQWKYTWTNLEKNRYRIK